MASTHKNLFICDLFNDTAKRSDCLMSNMCWMSDKIMGRRKYNCCIISCKRIASLRQKSPVISDDFVIALDPDI